jgi:hypothetical protein
MLIENNQCGRVLQSNYISNVLINDIGSNNRWLGLYSHRRESASVKFSLEREQWTSIPFNYFNAEGPA